MPEIQGRIPDVEEYVELQVHREIRGYWRVRYRYTSGKFARRSDWREAEHLTDGEVEDVLLAVWASWANDIADLEAF